VFAAALACLLVLAGVARAATITVTTTADDLTPNDGSVSLREAITAMDDKSALGDPDIQSQSPGTFGVNDTVHFNLSSGGPRQTIEVGSTGLGALPAIVTPVIINGYSEPGASANTLAHGDNAQIMVALDGANAGPSASGLEVDTGGQGSVIAGLDIFDFSFGQVVLSAGSDLVEGDDLGYDSSGAPTRSPFGVVVELSSNNVIGGSGTGPRNVISGTLESGIHIQGTTSHGATGNLVENNLIGTDPSGTRADGDALYTPYTGLGAVWIDGGSFNTVGGPKAGQGNVISGNGAGVDVTNGAQQNIIQGNLIGLAADGTSALRNQSYGVRVGSSDHLSSPPLGAGQPNEPPSSSNIIGADPQATTAGGANTIAFNGGDGVLIQGTPQNNSTQAENSGNSVLANSIFSNGGLGIDLLPETGGARPDNLLPAPTVTAVKPGAPASTVQGSLPLAGYGGMTMLVEVFSSPSCGPGGHGQGRTLIGSESTSTSGVHETPFSVKVAPPKPGQIITATATNTGADPTVPSGSADLFDTSGFSNCLTVPGAATATKVVCQPTVVRVGSGTTCTATVSDLVAGAAGPPTGQVHFVSTGKGSFSHGGSCALSSGRCRLTYTPSAVGAGSARITAAYGGDRAHGKSSAHASLTVHRRKP
jgi:CSLREA domain-containing protein